MKNPQEKSNIKLIYISFIKLTDKVARDWYIDYSIAKGATVEYWDVVSLLREEHNEHGSLNVDYLRHLQTYQEFEELIKQPKNKNAVYIILISYSARFSKPFRLLSKHNCKMVFLSWGAMPTTASIPLLQRIIYRFLTNPVKFFSIAIDKILSRFYRKLNLVKKFELVFTAGSLLTSTDQYTKKVIEFNLCDFDHYKRLRLSSKRIIQEKYAVFLDINLPYQSDLAVCGLPAANATRYFKSLNRFFDLLEKKYSIKVVIATHPKSNYSDNEFGQRERHRLLTAELVKDAEYVITHTSTALSYAVLNLKPTIFIYNDEMLSLYKNTIIWQIEGLAAYLGANVYNIDQIHDVAAVDIQSVNREQYEKYKYSFLTSHASEKFSSAEIFWGEITKISKALNLKEKKMTERLLSRLLDINFLLRLPSSIKYKMNRLYHEKIIFKSRSKEEIFTSIWQSNYWGSNESLSGPGSTLEQTMNLRKEMPIMFEKMEIKSVFDAPCGDMNWMQYLLKDASFTYLGGDIVGKIVDDNKKKFTGSKVNFIKFDITNDTFPTSDVWLCRAVFFHLSNHDIYHSLENFCASDSKYLLTTNHITNDGHINKDIITGDWRLLNLTLPPFNFPKVPLWEIDDYVAPQPAATLALYAKEQIKALLPKIQKNCQK